MRLGHALGIFLIMFGGFFSFLASSMLNDAGVTLKIFTAGPALLGVGVSFLFFPGGNITPKESREGTKDPQTFFTKAPTLHKVMWAVFGAIGYFVGAEFIPV